MSTADEIAYVLDEEQTGLVLPSGIAGAAILLLAVLFLGALLVGAGFILYGTLGAIVGLAAGGRPWVKRDD